MPGVGAKPSWVRPLGVLGRIRRAGGCGPWAVGAAPHGEQLGSTIVRVSTFHPNTAPSGRLFPRRSTNSRGTLFPASWAGEGLGARLWAVGWALPAATLGQPALRAGPVWPGSRLLPTCPWRRRSQSRNQLGEGVGWPWPRDSSGSGPKSVLRALDCSAREPYGSPPGSGGRFGAGAGAGGGQSGQWAVRQGFLRGTRPSSGFPNFRGRTGRVCFVWLLSSNPDEMLEGEGDWPDVELAK